MIIAGKNPVADPGFDPKGGRGGGVENIESVKG